MDNTKRKKWKTISIIIVGMITLILVGGILASAPGRREIQNLVINSVNFNNLRDGTYVGEYKGTKDSFRNTQVEVTILGGKISNIKILKGALDKDGLPIAVAQMVAIQSLKTS